MRKKGALLKSIRDSLRAIVSFIVDSHNQVEFPIIEWDVSYWKRTSETGATLVNEKHSDQSIWELLWPIKESLESRKEYSKLSTAIMQFIEFYGVDMQDHLWWNPTMDMIVRYFSFNEQVSLNDEVILGVVDEFVEESVSSTFEVVTEYELVNFKASKAFTVSDEISFKPMTMEYINTYNASFPRSPQQNTYISDHSWICSVKHTIPKISQYDMNILKPKFSRALVLSLFLIDDSNVKVRTLSQHKLSVYQSYPTTLGSLFINTGNGQPLVMDNEKTKGFIKIFRALHAKNIHRGFENYLTRTYDALQRSKREDSYVDLVIGLESLLAADSPQLETTFRFALRGTFILVKQGGGDPKTSLATMKKIYGIRSKIVHGNFSSKEINDNIKDLYNIARIIFFWVLGNLNRSPESINKDIDISMIAGKSG